jgi:hypothetical protein
MHLHAAEVVGGALAGAGLRPGDDRPVARARELLELGLGLAQRAGGELGGLGAELERLGARDRRQPQRPARFDRGRDAVRVDVEVVRVGVVEGGAHVGPVVAQRRLGVLFGREHELGLGGQEVEQLAEAVDGQQLGDVGTLVGALVRGHLRQLAMLRGELRRRRDLGDVGLAERALRERREPAQRLDLVVEEVDADRALLRRRVEVEQAAADGELPAVLDLVDALVARGDEVGGALLEVEQLADPEHEPVRAQRGVGDLLAQSHGGHPTTGARAKAPSRARRRSARPPGDRARASRRARRPAGPTRCGGRREVGLVGDAAARVEAHGRAAQPGAEVLREVARGAVVAGDHERRGRRIAVGEGGEHERAQGLRDERAAAVAHQGGGAGIAVELVEEGAQSHGFGHAEPPRAARGGGC